ncbi:ParB/RepB/Spo0J family partition protein [Cupriavidus sp. BIC8F]|uniref:ParB/RepB/Spo0J family partition protein n=1 Tax=Cupriavidus sp. BIC8F TaxID=3079014 RepID=UPI0029164B36|nr:ParB/RepB/Spo0J family partition protein [Cupriavidus sp. BIC8F]
MNMRKRMLEQTANLTPANEIKVEIAPQVADRPKTAPGMMAALSAAQLRIQELESQGAASTVPVEKIRPNPWQPRIKFDESSLTELAESIKELGLMQPILVRRVTPDNGESYFELIAGERRWRAHQVLGLQEIKALITDASDADMAVLALAENVSREDLTDYEIGKAMRRVEKEFPDRKRMAESMGMSRSTLYRYFAFDNLPQFMRVDLEKNPSLFSGTAASDTYAVLKKHGEPAVAAAREVWKQLVDGSLEQSKVAKLLEASLLRREATPVTSQRDIHKVYAGKTQAGSITKDSVSFTVKLKSAVLTAAQEERIRTVINELFDGGPQR